MSDEAEKAPEAEETNSEEAKGGGGGGMGRLLVIAFIGLVVVLETAMFFLLVPSAEQVSAMAEEKLIESLQEGKEEAEELEDEENKIEEFEMGMYGEIFSPHGTEKEYRVEVNLFGTIRKRDAERMKDEFESKQGRIRNAIRTKIRNSQLEELQENQQGLLQRRILTQCNHLLEEDLLLSVGFKSYQLMEQ